MSGEQQIYSVVYAGKLAPGKELEEVKQKLAALFRREPSQLDAIFSGSPCTIKKGIAMTLARQYLAAMAKVGAIAEIIPSPATPVTAPAKVATPAPAKPEAARRAPDPAELLNAFSGQIEPVRPTMAYRFWLLAVALGMISLLLVYAGVTLLSAYGVYYHATVNVSLFRRIGSVYIASFVYLFPIVTGGILVLLMLRPLIYLFSKEPPKIALTREKEPLLFAYVEKICKLVGAPRPKCIELDSQVNASASLRHGLFSFFGNDLALTIGMPLVAGLTTRQFAGVLAHEFGHFSQGAGMRLVYLIRLISHWLATAVYGRGGLDHTVNAWSHSESGYIALLFMFARMFVGVVRGVLWLFMVMGHAISGSMLRQMEFDADRYESRMAGSDAFADTSAAIVKLNYAMAALQQDLYTTWENNRYLVDNLSEAVVDRARHLPQDTLDEIRERVDTGKTGLFDTHPCDRERIENAEHENSPGIFKVELPASILFTRYTTWAKQVTFKHYRDDLGLKFSMQQLLPLSKIKGNVAGERNSLETLEGYFRGSFNPFVPFCLPEQQQLGAGGEQGLRQKWQQAVDAQYHDNDPAKLAWSRWNKADDQYYKALAAQTSLNHGLNIDPRAFGLQAPDPGLAQMKMDDASAAQAEAVEKLGAYFRTVAARVTAALGFLFREDVTIEIKERVSLRSEVETILPMLPVLQNALRHITLLKEQFVVLGTLFHALNDAEADAQAGIVEALNKVVEDGTKRLMAIHDLFGELPYPFEHAKGRITLRQHIFAGDPRALDPPGAVAEIESVLGKVVELYTRVAGRLITIAHSVEQAMGLRAI